MFHIWAIAATASRTVCGRFALISIRNPTPAASGLIIIKLLGLIGDAPVPYVFWCAMRFSSVVLACTFILTASAALADSRVFIIANQADGYGVDACLAKGDKCGASAARAYCQSRDFAQATAFRRVDPDEITGAVPKADSKCAGGVCGEYIAITCQR